MAANEIEIAVDPACGHNHAFAIYSECCASRFDYAMAAAYSPVFRRELVHAMAKPDLKSVAALMLQKSTAKLKHKFAARTPDNMERGSEFPGVN